ncbi:MAG: DEAD/DEAH box helicase [bacterium]|nr:DEAD/DEAH box helicase [bacterium]
MKKLEKFRQLNISDNILQALEKKGFEEPTPIQEKIIPVLLDTDNDLVGQAQTGTGKTAAYGIPIIDRIEDRAPFVQVLVVLPTRELAIQVSEELQSLKGRKKLQISPIYGGQSLALQNKRLKKGLDIVVGTPGRLLDHIRGRRLDLSRVSYVVLDEADEMLNMGFIEDINLILKETHKDKITLLFSATMPKEIVRVAKKYMRSYEKIHIEQKQAPVDLTDQIYFEVSARDKFEALCRIVDFEEYFYGLVFCRTRVDVDNVTTHLIERGYDAAALHGGFSQAQREKILGQFKKQQLNILVASDVAARGIDVHDLTHVINFSLPQSTDSYIHRIGRTGRAGKEGTAITFITPKEYQKLMQIERTAKTKIRKEHLPDIKDIIQVKSSRIKKEIEKISMKDIPKDFMKIAGQLLKGNDPERTVAALLKHIFKDELHPGGYNQIRDEQPAIKGETRLFVARGTKDRMTKSKLVAFIKKKAKISDQKINDVQVFQDYSFITVPFKEAEIILKSFKKQNKGQKPVVVKARKR